MPAISNAARIAREQVEKEECTKHYQESDLCHARCLQHQEVARKELSFWKAEVTEQVTNDCYPQNWQDTYQGMGLGGILLIAGIIGALVIGFFVAVANS